MGPEACMKADDLHEAWCIHEKQPSLLCMAGLHGRCMQRHAYDCMLKELDALRVSSNELHELALLFLLSTTLIGYHHRGERLILLFMIRGRSTSVETRRCSGAAAAGSGAAG